MADKKVPTLVETPPFKYRGISKDTYQHFGFKFWADQATENVVALEERYSDTNSTLRNLTEEGRKFLPWNKVRGTDEVLGGKDLFSPNSGKFVTLVLEGGLDALSVAESFDCKYPVVWSMSAESKFMTSENYEYLTSFPNIVVVADNDKPGQKALTRVLEWLPPAKTKVMDVSPYKDANELLEKCGETEVVKRWWAARKFSPDYLYTDNHQFSDLLSEERTGKTFETPFPTLNEVVRGLSTGHVYLLKGQEGIGKTELLRRLAYHMMTVHKEPVGTIFLEESPKRTLMGFASYVLGQPVHFPDCSITKKEIFDAIQSINDPEGLLNVYRVRSLDDPLVIVTHIEYLIKVQGCRFVFLDPVQQLISLTDNSDETKTLDTIAVKLEKLAVDSDACIIMTSHVNDEGRTRSSRMLSKSASVVLDLQRDITALNVRERNTTQLTVVKNRPFSTTGPAGKLFFDISTFDLSELNEEVDTNTEPF